MKTKKQENSTRNSNLRQSLWEFVKFTAIAAIIIIPIRLWVAQPFIVSGSSMVPNFENGEYLIVDEFSYHFRGPARGEIIIFRYPNNPSKFFIKRIIGLPNETIEINNGEIRIYNEEFPGGVDIEETYLQNKPMDNLTVTLGNDEYYVMGDNRSQSSDSRIWGPLQKDLMIGRAWMRLWPPNKASIYF